MSELNTTEENTQTLIINKGSGAGGANTNYYGKKFEEKTNNQQRLMEMGYVKNSFTKNPKKSYDYYLSKTTTIGATWGDIPNESYKRPSFLLTDLERSIYPENEINVKGAYDIWWNGNDQKSVSDFLRVIELTEPRFINQTDLVEKITQSQEVKILSNYCMKVKSIVATNQADGTYFFLPEKEVDGIPIIWFKASEKVLKENNEIINAHKVRRLAADAYRQNKLDNA